MIGRVGVLVAGLAGSTVSAASLCACANSCEISSVVVELCHGLDAFAKGANGLLSDGRTVIGFECFRFGRALRRGKEYA